MTKPMLCSCAVAAPIVVKSAGVKMEFRPRFAQRLFATAAILYQEARYGKGMRLHNVRRAMVQGKVKAVGWTCTICGTRKDGQ